MKRSTFAKPYNLQNVYLSFYRLLIIKARWEACEGVSYMHTHKYLSLFYYYSAFTPIPIHNSLTVSTLFHSYRKLLEFKMQGLFEGRWRVVVHVTPAGSQIPVVWVWKYHLHPPFQPYTLQLSPLMCRLHTNRHPLSQKKRFFIRTFVLRNVSRGVTPGYSMGSYGTSGVGLVLPARFLMAARRCCHYDVGTGDVCGICSLIPSVYGIWGQWWPGDGWC